MSRIAKNKYGEGGNAQGNNPRVALLYHEQAEVMLEGALGKRYREYRNNWAKAGKCELAQKYPIHLNFELFYGCNLKCVMCVNSLPEDQRGYVVEPNKRISFDKYCEIIDEGVRHGLSAVALNGYNEPLLYPQDLIRSVKYARDAGIIDVFTITNATLLTPVIAEGLIGSGLTQIKFSMDSIKKDTYEKIRIGANYENTMDNIHKFLEIKRKRRSVLPITRISIVKMKENVSEVDEFVDYWTGKIDYITIQDMTSPFVGNSRYGEFEDKARIETQPLKACAIPYQRLYIRNNGDILPCCSWYGREIVVGNIYKDRIYDVWNGDKMAEFRRDVNGAAEREPLQCRKCRHATARQGRS